MKTKTCKDCGVDRRLEVFTKDKSKKDGLNRRCKICNSKRFKKWRLNNLEKDKKRVIEYHRNNKEKRKEYYENNKPAILERQKEYVRIKKSNDLEYRLATVLRKRIWSALRNNKTRKTTKSKILLGCEITEFKKYLQLKFKAGMSWSNYGKWEIDHIVPCSMFDLKDEYQQKLCFNYSNCQPLWKTENRKKKDKIL